MKFSATDLCYKAYSITVIFLPSHVHSYTRAPYVCNVIVISVFKALHKHQLNYYT